MRGSGTKTSLPSTSNYMKSTASVDARREPSKVSTKIPQTSPDYNSTLHKKGSANSTNMCLNSSKDSTERLARATSLKMKTLKKRIPSFKKETAEVKKGSTNSPNICLNSSKVVAEKLARTSGLKVRTLKKRIPSFKKETAEVEKGSTNSPNICSNSSKGVTEKLARTSGMKVSTLKKRTPSFKKETAELEKGSTNFPNICSNSSKGVAKRLARTSSLKVRTLKKRTPSFKKDTAEVKNVLCKNLHVKEATCSSTLKDRKFSDSLKQSPGAKESEGTSGVKVCSYSHCSLNGHRHALKPPLKSFISARRRVLKTERSIKLRCQLPEVRSTGGSPNCTELIGGDGLATSNGEEGIPGNLSDGEMCGDIDTRENLERIGDLETAAHVLDDFMIKSDDGFGRFFDEISVSQESFDENSLNELVFEGDEDPRIGTQSGNTMMCCNAMDREAEEHNLNDELLLIEDASTEMGSQESYLSKGLDEEMTTWVDIATSKAIKRDQDHVENACNQAEYFSGASTEDLTNEPYPAECNVVHEVDPRNMAMPQTEEKSSTGAAVNCEKSNQESDEPRCINPHELHFLPLKPDPEAEKVNFDRESLNELFFEGNETPRVVSQSGNTMTCCNAMDREEHNLNDELIPNEDANTEIGSQASYLSKGLVEEMTTWVDSAASKAIKRDQDKVENVCNQAEYFSGASTMDLTNEPYPAECNAVHEVNPRNIGMPETEEKSLIQAAVKCEKSNQESDEDEPRFINPHGLHFLPLEPDPEAEKVNFDSESLNELFFEGNETLRVVPQSGNTMTCCNAMDREEHNLNDELIPNEDASTEIGSPASYLSMGLDEEMTTWVDSAVSKAIKRDQDHVENVCNQAEYFSGASTKDLTNEPYPAECNVVHEVNPRNMGMTETEEKSLILIRAAVKCEKSNQESDELRFINPQELHFLPLEPDPEAEKVNLRRQELLARKNAEEWMVDYALREAVTRISPDRQRKVELLVEAFERVLPTSKG